MTSFAKPDRFICMRLGVELKQVLEAVEKAGDDGIELERPLGEFFAAARHTIYRALSSCSHQLEGLLRHVEDARHA